VKIPEIIKEPPLEKKESSTPFIDKVIKEDETFE